MTESKTLPRSQLTLRIPSDLLALLDERVKEAHAAGYPVERGPLAVAYLERGARGGGGLPSSAPARFLPEPEWSRLDSARQKALDIAINFSGGDSEEPASRVADAAMELIGVVAEVLTMRGVGR